MKRFRGGLVFKAHRLLYHLTIGIACEDAERFASDLSFLLRLAALSHDWSMVWGCRILWSRVWWLMVQGAVMVQGVV